MATVELVCAREVCGVRFERSVGEHNRSVKRGRPEYCSQSCQVAVGNTTTPRGSLTPGARGEWRDELSPFRSSMRSIRGRDRETDIDVTYLRDLWDAQGGRCALSGLEMELPETTASPGSPSPLKASVDRVDHAIGYRRGNVRWVTYMANVCRNGFEDKDVVAFCRAVAAHAEA